MSLKITLTIKVNRQVVQCEISFEAAVLLALLYIWGKIYTRVETSLTSWFPSQCKMLAVLSQEIQDVYLSLK